MKISNAYKVSKLFLVQPGVFYHDSKRILMVCGFTDGSSCKWTWPEGSGGETGWKDVYSQFDDEIYKLAYSSRVGSVMAGSNSQSNIYFLLKIFFSEQKQE